MTCLSSGLWWLTVTIFPVITDNSFAERTEQLMTPAEFGLPGAAWQILQCTVIYNIYWVHRSWKPIKKIAIFLPAEVIFTPSDGINEVCIYIFRRNAILRARQLRVTWWQSKWKTELQKTLHHFNHIFEFCPYKPTKIWLNLKLFCFCGKVSSLYLKWALY